MLMPERVKYRKMHRGRTKGRAKGGTSVHLVNMVYRQSSQGGFLQDKLKPAELILVSAVRKVENVD